MTGCVLKPYLDALDLSRQSRERRALLADRVVPALLNRLAAEGLDAVVGYDLDLVAEFQAAHAKSDRNPEGMPLFGLFDPRCQPSAGRHDTLVLAVMRQGVQVANLAARLKWVETTLHQELRSLNLQYEDRSSIPEGEICLVGEPTGTNIRACHVSLSGAAYVVKDERGFGLYRIMSRLLPILTLTSWRWSWMATLMTKDNTFATGTDTVGYQRFEARIFRVLPGQEIRKREYYLATAERQDVQRTIFRPETAELNIPLGWPTEHDIAEAHRAVWGEEHSDLYS